MATIIVIGLSLELAPSVGAGLVSCSRCELPIEPGEPWHLDHADNGDPNAYRGASHAYCNTTASMIRATHVWVLREDDPDRGIYWGPPTQARGEQLRWSRPWFDWRSDPEYAGLHR